MLKKIIGALCVLLAISMPITIASTTSKKEVHFSAENSITTSINQVADATQTVTSIEATGSYKTSYFVDDSLSVANFKLRVTFEDGSTQTINVTSGMITGFDSSSAGERTMTITYLDATTTVTYQVVEPRVTFLELRVGFQTSYYTGDALNISGGVLFARYENNKTEEVSITSSMISGFSTSSPGTRNLTITYKEKSITKSYSVQKLLLTKIETADFEINYFVGDELPNPCGKIRAYYNKGYNSLVNINPDTMVTNFDTTTPGNKTLNITFSSDYNTITIAVDYTVTKVFVTSISVNSFDTEYFVGDELPNPCGTIKAYHNNGYVETIDVDPSTMVENFDTTSSGTGKRLTIKYSDQSTVVIYNVTDVIVSSIVVNQPYPDTFQLEYYQNQEISLEGGTLKATYNNGVVEEAVPITNDMVSNFATEFPGTYEIKITYKNAYTVINYVVTEVNITYIEVSTGLSKSNYYMYEPLDLTGCVIKVVYDNSNVEYIPATDIEVHHTGFANTLPGEDKVLTFKYEGFETTLTYNIIDAYIIVDEDLHLNFSVGQELNVSGITATLFTDNYSTSTNLTITADMISGFDTSTAGTRYLILSYDYGKPALIPYTVR